VRLGETVVALYLITWFTRARGLQRRHLWLDVPEMCFRSFVRSFLLSVLLFSSSMGPREPEIRRGM